MTLLPWSQLCRGAWAVRGFALLPSQVSSRWSLYSSSCFSTEPNIRRRYGRWSVRTQKTHVMPVLVIGFENRFYTNHFLYKQKFWCWRASCWVTCLCLWEWCDQRKVFLKNLLSFFEEYLPIHFPISSFCVTFVDCMCSFKKSLYKMIYQCDAE